jgi:polyvinyl alcohol dehydrogenase (cytochrome)
MIRWAEAACRLCAFRFVSTALIVSLCTTVLLAQSTASKADGEAVYKRRCAGCHEQLNPRIPPRSSLAKMPSERILRALDFGAMMTVAYPLNRAEREAVAAYLGTNTSPAVMFPPSAYCSNRNVTLAMNPKSAWNGWSPSENNDRYQPPEAASLSIDQVRKLKLKWAFGFDGDVTAFAQPTIIDGQVFVGSAGGAVHALRAETGCVQWTFQANGPVRSAILAVPLESSHALLFGDQTGWFYALEAESGKLLWKKKVEEHEAARLTGAPVAYNGNVFVPVASWEETRSLDSNYPCCTFRGSLVALRIRDGQQAWKSYLVPEPKQTGKSRRGTPQFGPSGAGVWSAPTLDARRGLMYIATGDNYSTPATPLSDAIVALEIATGRVVWSRQTTTGDAFNSSCGTDKQNCPDKEGPDYDFGSSAILTKLPDGRDVLLAGQKSGVVYALDPGKNGEILWQFRIASRAANVGPGVGVQWGMAADGQRVFAAVASAGRTRPTDPLDTRRSILDPRQGGGLFALRIADGTTAWSAAPIDCEASAPSGCSPAQPAALTAIQGAVFSASMDGHVRAYTTEDGRVIWDFNTVREFQTVNGVKAKGGSIDGAGPVVANGLVLVNSGYSRFGGMPGNVLLAFSP